jgi:hypothetical protein
MGWSKHSLSAGDKVALDINPLRDGPQRRLAEEGAACR